MSVVTNRGAREANAGDPAGLAVFGQGLDRKGPNEPRIVSVERRGRD
jgi:hypothetical protein